jgi:hypothetical protein
VYSFVLFYWRLSLTAVICFTLDIGIHVHHGFWFRFGLVWFGLGLVWFGLGLVWFRLGLV